MSQGMNKNPLVSICTTFFNAERYIHRLLDSCLNQTYKNVEIVIVDDASTDKSERVIREYAVRDSRVKYFSNDKKVGVSESFLKMAQLAKGDFAMVLGADDWLAKDYIENGVCTFLKHPDIAGVVPDLTTLFERGDNGVFTFGGRVHFSSKIKVYPAKWFLKYIYRPEHLYISGYAFVRSKDLVSAMNYYIKNYYHNPSQSVPEELRGFFKRALGIDSMLFPEILTRYKSFAFDPSLNYIKVEHSKNQRFDLEQEALAKIFQDAHYYLLIYKYIYKYKWSQFYRQMKIYKGAETLSSAFVEFFRSGFRQPLLNFREGKEPIRNFFGEFSFDETLIAAVYSAPMVVWRCLSFTVRNFVKKYGQKARESSVFTQENFLDSERHFRTSRP